MTVSPSMGTEMRLATEADPAAATGPVVVSCYGFSGAARVQEALAAGTELACTSGTGIVPLCEAAADSWRRVEGQHSPHMSRLATVTLRGLVTAQVTTILAATGSTRWCELATAPPTAFDAFLQVFPQAAVVCTHRQCLDMVCAAVSASPWGLQAPRLRPYLMSYPGNSVAALAAYWANSTEELLAFEQSHPGTAHRVRYEDVTASPEQTLRPLRAALGLPAPRHSPLPEHPEAVGTEPRPAGNTVPVEMLPPPLRQRVSRLHSRLGYPPLTE